MFLSCGDSLYDMFVGAGGTEGQPENLNDNTRIAIAGVVGGSPMNVALGLSRFGHSSSYLTKLSTDIFGQRIGRFLDNNAIDRSLSVPTDYNTTLAMVELGDDGAANYAFYINNTADVSLQKDELPSALPASIRALHFGSYSTAVDPVAGSLQMLAARESESRIISYDPNLRLSIEPNVDVWRESFAKFAKAANLIKASDEDIEALYGKGKEDAFVADCFSHNAELVYITRGPDGASAFTADGQSAVANGLAVNVVDTVGAGDTFQAAILHWLASNNHIDTVAGEGSRVEVGNNVSVGNNVRIGTPPTLKGAVDLEASLAFAIKAAAITCTRQGADLPTLTDLE